MKKIFFLLTAVATIQCAAAQELANKIPANANAVASIHGAKLTAMLSPEEWDKTTMGKKMKEMMSRDSGFQFNSVKDFGIDLSGSFYYFNTDDDSTYYNYFLAPLADVNKLEKLFAKKDIVRLANNVRRLTDDDSSGVAIWNNQQFIYVNASLKEGYYQDSAVAARHGLSYTSYNYYDPVYADTTAVIEESTVTFDTTVAVATVPEIMIEETTSPVDTIASTITDYQPYDEGSFDYYKDRSIKKKIAAACASYAATEIFYKTPEKNIFSNTAYVSSASAEAAASVWVDKPMDLYYRLMPYNYFLGSKMWPYNNVTEKGFGYKSFASHLLLNEKQMRIHSQVEMSEEIAAIQKQILDRKINKRFYKYINTDSMLGYMTWAFNTKAYLQQFPALMEKAYGNMGLGRYSDEYSVAAEFFSFLIDEEAIAKMVKGDMMVLFDGVFQQETTYTDYTYNDDFEQTAVEKTKKETLPRFLMMISSEENSLAKKLVKYGMNKSVVKQVDGFYEIEVPRSPMRFYFMYKDDVFFLTNSLENIRSISNGNFKANISKDEKKFIGNHNFSMYMNPKSISGQIASTEVGATESLTAMLNTFNKMGEVRMQLNPVKNNTGSTDIWMDVPKGNANALTLLLEYFEKVLSF